MKKNPFSGLYQCEYSEALLTKAYIYFNPTKGITSSSKPYIYLILSKPGFEIVSNINNTFANEFYAKDKEIDEFSVRIHDSDGLPFANNKGNANFIIILSY